MSMRRPKLDELSDFIQLRHGKISGCRAPLYAIMRDERFFLPAFLHHYRELGIDQFVILDDGSQDGTFEYLCEQPDCAVLTSDRSFGEHLSVIYPDGQKILHRWGAHAKALIPRKFLAGKAALYVDADEFLILPRGLSLPKIMSCMSSNNIDCIAANLVEFFPASMEDISGESSPATFDDLINLYPYFDSNPLVVFCKRGRLQKVGKSSSVRLFQDYGVGRRTRIDRWVSRLKMRMGIEPSGPKAVSATGKTPLIRWTSDVYLKGSHRTNVPPTPDALLTLAHFKFTHDLTRRIARAVRWKTHSAAGGKYLAYQILAERMQQRGGSFLGPASVRYEHPDQLERLGLLRWNIPC